MQDFKEIIADFAERDFPFEDLEGELVRRLKGDSEALSGLLQALDTAKDECLVNDSQYNQLLARLVASDTIVAVDTGGKGDDEIMRTHDPRQFFAETDTHGQVEIVGPGTIIKDRFELLEVLGEGGMGMVYRARDLIKVEASDRNPYLAIKVLNDNFKRHPESFISLQRECSRTQKLAHPNIATVFDFDRYGSMVYMTMQLLEGKPLNDFISEDVPEGGLSFKEAMPLIEDMGNALSYAHSSSIVHSDFKPGNAFVTDDHGVQVLDFGIARAVKKPGQQDTTLFDAGKLGALTPSYASCEMLEEEEPDPRDDIYALAVVSYILLSGSHPFDKFPATMARDHKMVARPLKKLTRSQNGMLQKGLSFHRDKAPASVQVFLNGLRHKSGSLGKYSLAAVVGVVSLALIAIYPVQNYLKQQREAELVSLLGSSDPVIVEETLSNLNSRDDISVQNVLSLARDSLVAYYSQQIDDALTGELGPNNFQLATTLMTEVQQLYPESVEVKQLNSRIEHHKTRAVDFVDTSLQQVVNELDVMAAGEEHSVPQLFETLDKADSGNALRKDVRIPVVYAEMIDTAIAEKRLLDADILLKQAFRLYPENEALLFLRSEMNRFSDAGYLASEEQEKADEGARQERMKKRRESLESARVEAAKRSLLIKTRAGRPDKAVEFLEVLENRLSSGALFITDIAPTAIAESYLALATSLAEAGQYDRAVEMLDAGLEVTPENNDLKVTREKYNRSPGL